MQTLGIDLSTDPRKVWICQIDWEASPPVLLELEQLSEVPDRLAPPPPPPVVTPAGAVLPAGQRRRATAPARIRSEAGLIAELVERITAFEPSADRLVALDAPLGWPTAFVEAVVDWDEGDPQGFRKRPDLRLRATDRFVQAVTRVTPMSVSTDRMGSTAMLLAEVLSRTARRLDRAGYERVHGRDGVVEAHPASALRSWTTPGGGALCVGTYKGWTGARELIVLKIAQAGVQLSEEQARACVDCDDALDALLCALVARAVGLGRTLTVGSPVDVQQLMPRSPNGGGSAEALAALTERLDLARSLQAEAARTADREGWIHLPSRADLAASIGTTPGSASWLPEPREETDVHAVGATAPHEFAPHRGAGEVRGGPYGADVRAVEDDGWGAAAEQDWLARRLAAIDDDFFDDDDDEDPFLPPPLAPPPLYGQRTDLARGLRPRR